MGARTMIDRQLASSREGLYQAVWSARPVPGPVGLCRARRAQCAVYRPPSVAGRRISDQSSKARGRPHDATEDLGRAAHRSARGSRSPAAGARGPSRGGERLGPSPRRPPCSRYRRGRRRSRRKFAHARCTITRSPPASIHRLALDAQQAGIARYSILGEQLRAGRSAISPISGRPATSRCSGSA